MKIELICIGDLKFKGLKEVEQEYIKRINFFTTFGIHTVKDVKSDEDAFKKKKEGQAMLELLDTKDFVIALDEHGKKMSSVQFSNIIAEKIQNHPHRIVFLEGGHAGLSELLEDRIHLKISFSEMTFSHDIFRVLFLEQLYRAFTIIKRIKYHR